MTGPEDPGRPERPLRRGRAGISRRGLQDGDRPPADRCRRYRSTTSRRLTTWTRRDRSRTARHNPDAGATRHMKKGEQSKLGFHIAEAAYLGHRHHSGTCSPIIGTELGSIPSLRARHDPVRVPAIAVRARGRPGHHPGLPGPADLPLEDRLLLPRETGSRSSLIPAGPCPSC